MILKKIISFTYIRIENKKTRKKESNRIVK